MCKCFGIDSNTPPSEQSLPCRSLFSDFLSFSRIPGIIKVGLLFYEDHKIITIVDR